MEQLTLSSQLAHPLLLVVDFKEDPQNKFQNFHGPSNFASKSNGPDTFLESFRVSLSLSLSRNIGVDISLVAVNQKKTNLLIYYYKKITTSVGITS